jgi:mannose-6-phosphate isomerase class I
VQQNSDITYRLTDWGRTQNGKPRPLDIEKAMNVTDFYSMGVSKYKPSRMLGFPYKRLLLIKCEKFTMEAMELDRKRIKEKTNKARFQILTCTRGKGAFHYGEKLKSKTAFATGDTFLLPAHLGEYEVAAAGTTEIVVTYVE